MSAALSNPAVRTAAADQSADARIYGGYCARAGVPRMPPGNLPPDAVPAFLEGYDRERSRRPAMDQAGGCPDSVSGALSGVFWVLNGNG